MPDFSELVQEGMPDLEVLGEMRQFWSELLQFCKCSSPSWIGTLTLRCQSH